MEDVNLLGESVKFMILGMGIVFLFLIVMIYALKLQTFLITKFFKEEKAPEKTKEWQPSAVDDKQLTAVITAAIIHHNNNK